MFCRCHVTSSTDTHVKFAKSQFTTASVSRVLLKVPAPFLAYEIHQSIHLSQLTSLGAGMNLIARKKDERNIRLALAGLFQPSSGPVIALFACSAPNR